MVYQAMFYGSYAIVFFFEKHKKIKKYLYIGSKKNENFFQNRKSIFFLEFYHNTVLETVPSGKIEQKLRSGAYLEV